MATASPQLLRLLIQQNIDTLRGLRALPPRDIGTASGKQDRMTIHELEEQTEALHETFKRAVANPQPQRRRKSWREIDLNALSSGGVR